jgi:hypothetical protein
MHDSAMVGIPKHTRKENDFYPTPAWCTEALLYGDYDFGSVWEPACGDGAMADVLSEGLIPVVCSDLVDRGYGEAGVDFLKETEMFIGSNSIITNPPYGKDTDGVALSEKFLRHALELTENSTTGFVAMLLRNEFDCAKGRMDMFCGDRFLEKIVLTKRPMWIRGTKGSPRHNYAWYIFGPPCSEVIPIVTYYHPEKGKTYV